MLTAQFVLCDHNISVLFFGQLIAPIPKCAFGKLHYVPFVNKGDAGLALRDSEVDGAANKALAAGYRHRLDADAAIGTNVITEPFKQRYNLLRLLAPLREF